MMKILSLAVIYILLLASCKNPVQQSAENPLQGVWKLITGTTIEKKDTLVTDYQKGKSFIKIIQGRHFAFLGHDLNKGQDSMAFFSSGGGTCTVKDSTYTEHLEYCNARDWENNDFHFIYKLNKDTLLITGIERIDSIGINRINIEKYIREKKD
ncbi:hypothetical protein A8C56_11385 [Niabella ginsenosidivorans]|uniref:Lipocalin-like domain-containing protein n=1 Tax=Niabella ginsenosidivorans TaxID=1176587 RepID=A0A1A9I8F9_9BACT|nr:hypothetical protein [Niabella ginsenosidivorans]ANH83873.1 hypothetical protein A8C56_11385 [Niabella ginsenosidivorans]